jgi:hypothetical protein
MVGLGMSGSRPVLAAVFCTFVLGAGASRADSASDAVALREFEDGRAAFEKGQYADALKSFEASIQALPSPNTRLYMARCYRALGQVASAYTNFKRASHEAADRLNATGEKRYGATKEAALAEAIELEPKVPHVTIAVPSDAPGSTVVKLDAAEIPRTAWGTTLDINPGSHSLSANANRRVPFSTTFDLAEAQSKRVEVALARMPTSTITLVFKIRPAGVAAEIDGKPVEPGDLESERELDVGEHHVVARAPGYADFTWMQSLQDGERRRVEIALRSSTVGGSSRGTPKWLFFGVAAVSVVALGCGTYFALDATSRANDEKAKDPLVRDPAEQDKIRSESTTANVLFVGGAAIAAGAGVLAFTTDWKGGGAASSRTTARLVPWFGLGGAGAGVTGRF